MSNQKFVKYIAANPQYEKTLAGMCIYDMDKQQYIIQYNHNKNFTPASTTKLFSFYAGLKVFGNEATAKVPALQYISRADSLIIFGTGNPTFLHPDFGDKAVMDFLQNRTEKLYFSDTNWKDNHFGYGWSWDDYNDYYSTEKSVFPIYGNYVSFMANSAQKIEVIPAFFKANLTEDHQLGDGLFVQRKIRQNEFAYTLQKVNQPQRQEVPFVTSSELVAKMLSDTLKKEVKWIAYPYSKSEVKTLHSFEADSLYRRMLQPSDNFLAEQILLMCSSQIGENQMNTQVSIDFMLKNHLNDLTDAPRWVDGSGLSRMNLFSPRTQVELLLKIYKEIAMDKASEARLFGMLAIGGKAGTLRNLFKNYPPFVFAKTGSLSNNACLSGYLMTKSGRRLCFALMNNHYLQSTTEIRAEMEKILTEFYLKY
jgi:D-alanyl-D-alanine carboxypeptidase/D-alanyl-D-alanine-endopeptidase (penicillin-binding protein 4)